MKGKTSRRVENKPCRVTDARACANKSKSIKPEKLLAMKKHFKLCGLRNLGLFAILVASLLSNSCDKCELLDQTITHPPVDTMAVCEGVFYINQAGPSIDLSFFFNEFNKPIPEPFEYAQGPGPNPVSTLVYNIESNFSAFDSINQQYVFAYYYANGGPEELLFHHQDIATGVATFSSPMTTYAAPVFLNGFLYAIKAELVNTNVLYQIYQLDPLTGQQLGLMDSPRWSKHDGRTIDGQGLKL